MNASAPRCREWPALPWLTIALGLAAGLFYVVPGARERFQYDRPAICAGEVWRLASHHLVHRNLAHFVWDTVPFVCLAALCEQEHRKRFVCCIGLAVGFIALAVWVCMPALVYLGGLSGLVHGVFVLLAVSVLRDKVRTGGWGWILGATLLLMAALAYVGYELTTGNTVFGACPPGTVLPGPVCHAAGGLAGLAVGLAPRRAKKGEGE